MQTRNSNETALKQYSTKDGKRVLSIIWSGNMFRFVVEQLTRQPATSSLAAYDYWEEVYRSGLYGSAEAAEQDSMTAIEWTGQSEPNEG